MRFIPMSVPDVILMEPKVFADQRGFFSVMRHQQEFEKAGIQFNFVQDNFSRSGQGVLRGLHYQVKQPQGKLVRVIAGEVFDVAVDLRRSSPTFGKWVSAILTAENQRQLWVPPGFAHGFYVLSEHADFIYCCTDFYAPENERTILWDDPALAINWPLIKQQQPNLSSKDAVGELLKDAECYA
jgi:dTDP-4-dehydrorhamnose 3,5-epimerase